MPYNAYTTASDSIWAGVPLITCIGKSFASRVSSSILSSVGLNDLITDSIQEYQKAIEAGNNPEQAIELKRKISNKKNFALIVKNIQNLELSLKKYTKIFF